MIDTTRTTMSPIEKLFDTIEDLGFTVASRGDELDDTCSKASLFDDEATIIADDVIAMTRRMIDAMTQQLQAVIDARHAYARSI